MAVVKRPANFFETEEGLELITLLSKMVESEAYNTEPSYSADTASYPDNNIPFVDKHKNYLRTHPSIVPEQYIANLRLMTRIR